MDKRFIRKKSHAEINENKQKGTRAWYPTQETAAQWTPATGILSTPGLLSV